MAITLNGTTGISSPGGDTSTSLATTNLSYTGTLTGGTGVIAIGTNQIYKDASGNVGLGVTPSTWNTDRKPIQLGSGGNVSGSVSLPTFVEIGSNFYVNSSGFDTYLTTGTAAKYRQVGNVHYWFTAASGTAGTPVTDFNSIAMTLDASGNLGIGAASPSTYGKLAVLSSDNTEATVIQSLISNNTTAQLRLGFNRIVGYNTTAGNSSLDFGVTSYPQAVHIDSYGNLIVGGTSTSNKFEVYGDNIRSTARASSTAGMVIIEAQSSNYWTGPTYAGTSINQYGSAATGTTCGISNANLGALYFQNTSNALIWANGGAPIIFGITSTERARIDSSGNLLVGTTTSLGKVTISSATSSSHLYLTGSQQNAMRFTTAAGGAGIIIGRSISSDNANNFFVYDESASSTRMLLDASGYLTCLGVYNNAAAATNAVNVNSSGVVYRSTSSRKYKEEILDADFGLADVLKLRPITYASKNKDISGDRRFGGLIAEEVDEAGLGIFVEYADDGSPDNVHYGNMVSLAFKAIQELTTRLEALEAQ